MFSSSKKNHFHKKQLFYHLYQKHQMIFAVFLMLLVESAQNKVRLTGHLLRLKRAVGASG